ncbi:MAG: nicotinate-nucleotide--dimethylbenzimidazole phosphoribosyltransferase, partial [Anaerolineales bacterium]
MNKFEKIIASIVPPDLSIEKGALARQARLTKPKGSLGRLEALSAHIAAIQRKPEPVAEPGVVFVMAADHGVCAEGVSAYPQEVTAQMVMNFVVGGAAINVLSRFAGARVVVADMGIAANLSSSLPIYHKKIAMGTHNMAVGPAMSRKEAILSIETGINIFEEELSRAPFAIAATGDMGIGNTTASAAIAAVLTSVCPKAIVGRGTGIDDNTLARKIQVIETAIDLNKPDPNDGLDVLSKVGGFEIGAIAGVILAAAAHRIPVIIDGYISGAAALLANSLAPLSREYMIASHLSADAGHTAMLEDLELEPLLDLGMRLGEGTGAVLAMMLCAASCRILNEMATFETAGVT